MEAIILAGGFGTRLKDTVPNLPKPMAPIGDKPFLAMLLLDLARKGITRVIISTGFMALGMMLPGMIAGWIQTNYGYINFFFIVCLSTIPGFYLLNKIKIDKKFGQKDKK